MTTEQKLEAALGLLERALPQFEHNAPDPKWFKEYFALTGAHMVLTEEGWEPGDAREAYQPGEVLDEVNAPEG